MSFTASALIVSWAAIALLGFALAGVLARVHRLESALSGPEIGPPPVAGSMTQLGIDRGPVLVLFVDDGCASCMRAAEAVAELEERGRAFVYWRADAPEAFAAFTVNATPFAVVADADLRVVAAIPVGSDERMAEASAVMAALEANGAPTPGPT